jgi:hypothetical protein
VQPWLVGWTGFAQKIAMNIAHGKMLGFNSWFFSLVSTTITIQVSGMRWLVQERSGRLSDLIFFTFFLLFLRKDVCNGKWNPWKNNLFLLYFPKTLSSSPAFLLSSQTCDSDPKVPWW